jgi:hypothetical protein
MQHRFAVLRAEIGRNLDNVRRLVAEAEEWQSRLESWPGIVHWRN